MASITEITCKCGCGRKKLVRTADIKRGWGKYYDKSCKAKAQERKTGQYSNYIHKVYEFNQSPVANQHYEISMSDCYYDSFTDQWLEKDDDYSNGYNPHPFSGEAVQGD